MKGPPASSPPPPGPGGPRPRWRIRLEGGGLHEGETPLEVIRSMQSQHFDLAGRPVGEFIASAVRAAEVTSEIVLHVPAAGSDEARAEALLRELLRVKAAEEVP